MVAGAWHWDTLFMLFHFGWKATACILISNTLAFLCSGANCSHSATNLIPLPQRNRLFPSRSFWSISRSSVSLFSMRITRRLLF
jgi:hypothetical protein